MRQIRIYLTEKCNASCPWCLNKNSRKPNTGMFEYLQKEFGKHEKSQMIMIGDASGKPGNFSDSDKKCAENFGIDYHCCPVKILKYHLSSNSRNSVLDIQALI